MILKYWKKKLCNFQLILSCYIYFYKWFENVNLSLMLIYFRGCFDAFSLFPDMSSETKHNSQNIQVHAIKKNKK